MNRRAKCLSWAAKAPLLLGLLATVAVASAASVRLDVSLDGKNRAEAWRNAVYTATLDGLTRYLKSRAKDTMVSGLVEARLKEIAGKDYRPLVRKWRPQIDDRVGPVHVLEGKIYLDDDVLRLWADAIVKDLDKVGAGGHRLSVYIQPLGLDETDLSKEMQAMRKRFMYALEQELLRSNFDVKTDAQRQQAQYAVRLVESEYARKGGIGSVNFIVQSVENHGDGDVFSTAVGTANESVMEGVPEMKQKLLVNAAEMVAGRLREQLLRTDQVLELNFYASGDFSRRRARSKLVEGLADAFGYRTDDEIDQFERGLNLRETDLGTHYLYSVEVPREQVKNMERLTRDLEYLLGDVFDSREPRVVSASAGREMHVFERANPPAGMAESVATEARWQVQAEQLINEGKLDALPGVGKNALDTLRKVHRDNPKDPALSEYYQIVADAFTQQAEEAIDKEQFASARRLLDRAERIADVFPKLNRRRIDAARAALKKPNAVAAQAVQPVVQPPPAIIGPVLVFPEIESRLRGLTRVKSPDIVGLAAHGSGIRQVTANGREMNLQRDDGKYADYIKIAGGGIRVFRIPGSVADAKGRIQVQVEDQAGGSVERTLKVQGREVSILAADSDGERVLRDGRYWALLIGNQDYTAGVNSLATPLADVRALRKVLVEQYGFDPARVVVLENATRDQMLDALHGIHDKVQADDSLLIFYAGHGEQDKGFGGKGFWIPVDGLPPNAKTRPARATWLPNSDVQDIVQASRAKHVLLISDSCYSGTFRTRSLGASGEFAANREYLFAKASKRSRRAITSGDLEPVADGGGNGHSVFAAALLQTLENDHLAVNAERLFQILYEEVTKRARQQPQYFTLQGAGDAGGDFILVPKD